MSSIVPAHRTKYPAMQLSIVAEKAFESAILEVLTEEGAKGYTIFEGGGNGPFHMHPSEATPMHDALHLLKIEVIVHDPATAERMAERLMEEFFDEMPGLVALSEVQIFRPQKF
jgi:L-alanine-DL-glutamate epimerase-like enolase superfamily enzyme